MWFSAKILFKSVHNNKPRRTILFEEVVIVLKSRNEKLAQLKAEKIARKREHSYKNIYGETVNWKFQRIEAIQEILDKDLKEGTEVFSRFIRRINRRSK